MTSIFYDGVTVAIEMARSDEVLDMLLSMEQMGFPGRLDVGVNIAGSPTAFDLND